MHSSKLYAWLSELLGLHDHLLLLNVIVSKIATNLKGAVPFLEEYRCSPSRTTFHYTIGWLILMEDSPVKFKSSMDPLLQQRRLSGWRNYKEIFFGLLLNLWSSLFDWRYPGHMPLLLKGSSHWTDAPEAKKYSLRLLHKPNQHTP
ncbi:hypothetical protein CMV_007061 [Castanea mollissima]|uniref:Exportin-7/Ran-binding protein 17 TPR repeats domain-containing protein n=1 Tax=Castanea mollissima TaxID=60419 RepID=A0A8J4VSW8_9ROSI|nr:hypothetical protein CMV_007061 [Castanea mollissima]